MTGESFQLVHRAVMEENWGECGVEIWRKVKKYNTHNTKLRTAQSSHTPSHPVLTIKPSSTPDSFGKDSVKYAPPLPDVLATSISSATVNTPACVTKYQLRADDVPGKFRVGECVKACSTGRIDEGHTPWTAYVQADMGDGRYVIKYNCDKKIFSHVPSSWIAKT